MSHNSAILVSMTQIAESFGLDQIILCLIVVNYFNMETQSFCSRSSDPRSDHIQWFKAREYAVCLHVFEKLLHVFSLKYYTLS